MTALLQSELIVTDLETLSWWVDAQREKDKQIVLTSGTFDLLHIGHILYLEMAKGLALNSVLVVGMDSDEKVRARKGPTRPIVAEDERARILAALKSVDLVYIKSAGEKHWSLIKAVKPDVLVISQRSEYSPDELDELKSYCGQLQVLESQATTSTTARIRTLIISSVAHLREPLKMISKYVNEVLLELNKITGEDE